MRKMVLGGTSMTAGVLINYLPAHMVYRTPQMQRIYDGFLPMSNGAMIRDVDVPMIHVPTMHEVSGNITNKQDSDEPGQAVPALRVLGHGAHRHARQRPAEAESVRRSRSARSRCRPTCRWRSITCSSGWTRARCRRAPTASCSIATSRNDGSMMALDEHGNPRGGIRTTYVDVPTAKYVIRPAALNPVVANAAPYIADRRAERRQSDVRSEHGADRRSRRRS